MKNRDPQPSSEKIDSDASSSSSDGDAFASTPLPLSKEAHAGRHSDDSDSEFPILVKPLSDGTNLKKPSSTSADSPSKTPAKRKPASAAKDSKRPKKENGVGVGSEVEGKKSALFQRVWSDDDEIVVLKGILEYEEKKGADPMADTLGFHDFIKSSLHADFDRKQMSDKIRRLKKKYANSVFNKKNFTAHEQKAFDLSSKIWGNGVDDAVADHREESNIKTRTGSKAEASKGVNGDAVSSKGIKDSAMDNAGISCQFIGKWSISMGLDENIVKVGLELCRQDKKAEIEGKWKKLYMEESDLFIRKLDLAREESKMIAEALKSVGRL